MNEVDLNSSEHEFFKLRTTSPLTAQEVEKLNKLGGDLKYDNGLMALILIPPNRLNEFIDGIESILEIHRNDFGRSKKMNESRLTYYGIAGLSTVAVGIVTFMIVYPTYAYWQYHNELLKQGKVMIYDQPRYIIKDISKGDER